MGLRPRVARRLSVFSECGHGFDEAGMNGPIRYELERKSAVYGVRTEVLRVVAERSGKFLDGLL
jgi:hypothetical protein